MNNPRKEYSNAVVRPKVGDKTQYGKLFASEHINGEIRFFTFEKPDNKYLPSELNLVILAEEMSLSEHPKTIRALTYINGKKNSYQTPIVGDMTDEGRIIGICDKTGFLMIEGATYLFRPDFLNLIKMAFEVDLDEEIEDDFNRNKLVLAVDYGYVTKDGTAEEVDLFIKKIESTSDEEVLLRAASGDKMYMQIANHRGIFKEDDNVIVIGDVKDINLLSHSQFSNAIGYLPMKQKIGRIHRDNIKRMTDPTQYFASKECLIEFLMGYHKELSDKRSFPPLKLQKALHSAAEAFGFDSWQAMEPTFDKAEVKEPDDSKVFAELLAKISLSGITVEQMDDLSETMDLEPSEIHEIFIKAEKAVNRG
jgi:hypothetical protein